MQQSATILQPYEYWERSSPDGTGTGPRTTRKMYEVHFNGRVTIPVLLGL